MEHIGITLDASLYTLKTAAEFAEKHSLGEVAPLQRGDKILFFSKFEKVEELPTCDIPNVDIFKAGKWTDSAGNTVTYTAQDIEEMAADSNNAYALKLLEGPVKLGHNAAQKLAKEDGLPAVGWLSNFVSKSGVLYADLKCVPEKLAQLIKSGAYRKRSAEIIHGFKNPDGGSGKPFKHVIAGLSVLGATLPAISALSDVVKLYKGTPLEDAEFSLYQYDASELSKEIVIEIETEEKKKEGEKPMAMTPEEQKQFDEMKSECSKLKADLEAACDTNTEMASKLKKYEADGEAMEQNLTALKADMATYKADMEKVQKAALETEKKAFFSMNAKKATPADLPMFQEMFDVKAAQGTEALETFKSEFSKRADHQAMSEYGIDEGAAKPPAEDLNEVKIEKYCAENKLDINKASDYASAALAIMQYEEPDKL